MTASGQKRRFDPLSMTSDLPPAADIVTTGRHVAKVPKGDMPAADTNWRSAS